MKILSDEPGDAYILMEEPRERRREGGVGEKQRERERGREGERESE